MMSNDRIKTYDVFIIKLTLVREDKCMQGHNVVIFYGEYTQAVL